MLLLTIIGVILASVGIGLQAIALRKKSKNR
jgi:hypothetical protein